MIAFAVMSEAGTTLAIFREENDARMYAEPRKHDPAPIFKAVQIRAIVMEETIWHPTHKPLTPMPYLEHQWGKVVSRFRRSAS